MKRWALILKLLPWKLTTYSNGISTSRKLIYIHLIPDSGAVQLCTKYQNEMFPCCWILVNITFVLFNKCCERELKLIYSKHNVFSIDDLWSLCQEPYHQVTNRFVMRQCTLLQNIVHHPKFKCSDVHCFFLQFLGIPKWLLCLYSWTFSQLSMLMAFMFVTHTFVKVQWSNLLRPNMSGSIAVELNSWGVYLLCLNILTLLFIVINERTPRTWSCYFFKLAVLILSLYTRDPLFFTKLFDEKKK